MICDNNALTSLNVSSNTSLALLSCWNNPITSLNVNGCTVLGTLWAGSNSLSSLDVSTNTALISLDCNNNALGQASVDGILASLVTNAQVSGSVDLSGGTNATASAAGLLSKAILETSSSWTVTVN